MNMKIACLLLFIGLISLATGKKLKFFLAACAMVKNEMSVILEWIEFHRVQGVDHFIFFDDESTDDIYLLPRLYADLGYPDLVEIYPVRFRRYNHPWGGRHHDYENRQAQALNHCNARMTGVSQWLLVSDVDEFMFSPKFGSIAEYLLNRTKENTREIYVPVIRFGSCGVQKENRVRLSVDPYSDRVTVVNEMYNEDLLITSRNPKRAPFDGLDGDYEEQFNAICAATAQPDDCDHANGKSIWRPERCGEAFVHWCARGVGGVVQNPSVEELRINHYAFRSKEHVDGLPKHLMGFIKNKVYDTFDEAWFSSVEDDAIERFREELISRLSVIPSVTINVDHAKDETSGQE